MLFFAIIRHQKFAYSLLFLLFTTSLVIVYQHRAQPLRLTYPTANTTAQGQESPGRVSLSFEANHGQVNSANPVKVKIK